MEWVMAIHPIMGILGYTVNPYYWIDDYPILWESKPCLDHDTHLRSASLTRFQKGGRLKFLLLDAGTLW